MTPFAAYTLGVGVGVVFAAIWPAVRAAAERLTHDWTYFKKDEPELGEIVEVAPKLWVSTWCGRRFYVRRYEGRPLLQGPAYTCRWVDTAELCPVEVRRAFQNGLDRDLFLKEVQDHA